jgi:hypothetical protein
MGCGGSRLMSTTKHKRPIDAAEVKQAASSRWREILGAVCGIDSDLLDGKGHPCPACGGTDRFSAFSDFDTTGGIICRGCHATNNGDGLAAVAHFRGVEFAEALDLVAEHLGLKQGAKRDPRAAEARRPAASEASASAATPAEKSAEPVETFATADELIDSLSPQPSRTFDDYRKRDGSPHGMVHRFDATPNRKKYFKQSSLQGDGRWALKAMPKPSILYALHEWAGADPSEVIVVAEGEGKCDVLRSHGFLATTWAGGGLSAKSADWSEVGERHAVLWGDNDSTGRKAMDTVAELMGSLPKPPASLRRLQSPDLPSGEPMPEKGDAADWFAAGGTPEKLRELIANAEQVELPEPDEPIRRLPHPTHVYPEAVRPYLKEVARAVQVDEAMVGPQVLVAISGAIGASREVAYTDDWVETSSIYAAAVAPSGAGKTPSEEKTMAPARRRDAELQAINDETLKDHKEAVELFKIELEAWRKAARAGEIGDMPTEPERPPLLRAVVGDITPEALAERLSDNPRGLLGLHDELSGLLGAMDRYSNGQGAERALYLSSWSAKSISVDRKTGDKKCIFVARPHLTLFGGVQNDLLHDLVSDQDVAAGLPQRFLWTMPPVRRRYLTDATISRDAEASYIDMLAALYRMRPVDTEDGEKPVRVYLDAESRRVFKRFHDELEDEIGNQPGVIGGVLSKLKSYALRLALLVHCVQERSGELPFGEEEILHAETMEAGVTLAKWFANEAKRVFSIRWESKDDAEIRTLVEWIERHGGAVTDRELAKGPRVYREATKRAAAFKKLEDAGFGSWRITDTEGRQRHEFAVTRPTPAELPAAVAAEAEAPQTRELEASAVGASDDAPADWGFEL